MSSQRTAVNRIFGIIAFLTLLAANAFAETDPGWPRVYSNGAKKLVVYQPQIDDWKDYKEIAFRAAFQLTLNPKEPPVFGVVEAHSPTTVDSDTRSVVIEKLDYEIRLADVSDAVEARTKKEVLSLLPPRNPLTVSLDRILTYLDPAKGSQRGVAVNMNPPPIYYSDRPAALVIFVGEPIFKPIPGTELMFAVNTNWDLILDQQSSTYYLLNGDTWLSTTKLPGGSWRAAAKLPATFSKLPNDETWSDVRAKIPGKTAAKIPKIFESMVPAELIVTDGAAAYSPIPGTKLMAVANTPSPVFLYGEKKQYYYLVAGRWFRAPALSGPWTGATADLPADFVNFPLDHRLSYIRSSVPGTDEAADAVLLASIPQTTTINRSEAKLDVAYDGAPVFSPIAETSVQYAVNTPTDVFKVENAYYACFQGVWFSSSQPKGPWVLADSVPPAIYTIPPSSPKHNVTYVTVYNSSPTTVTSSYTGGYSGQYVSSGLLVFGAGIALGAVIANNNNDNYYYYPPPPSYYSYGGGAYYNYNSGGYYRSATSYGPYGGAGRSAYYNPSTGAYGRSAARVGPNGAAGARQGYNPFTDTYAARSGGVTPYGAASRGFVSQGDDWARGGQRANANGRVGWAENSEGGKAVAYDKRRGGQGGAVKTGSGDVYAGRNGTVYKHDNDGAWTKNSGDGWSDIDRSSAQKQAADRRQNVQNNANVQNRQAQASQQRASMSGQTRGSFDRSDMNSQLNRDSYARERGNQLSSRASSSYGSRSSSAASRSSRSSGMSSRSFGGGGGGGARRGGGGGGGRRR